MKTKLRFAVVATCLATLIGSTLVAQTRFPAQRAKRQTDKTGQTSQAMRRPVSTSGHQAQTAAPGMGSFTANTYKTEFDAAVEEHFDDKNLPGIVVLMARDGLVTYKKTLGYADIKAKKPVNENHVFRLASISKWVTALMALRLEEQGKINLKAKTRSYLPQMPKFHTSRVIDLIACRGGIRYYGDPTSSKSPKNWSTKSFASSTAVLPNFMHDPLAADVQWYYYSTLSSEVVGACMEKKTGKTTPQLVRSLISNPFGINTLRTQDLNLKLPARVKLYKAIDLEDYSKGNKESTPDDLTDKRCGGGMEASSLDLLKLGMKFCDKKVVSNASMNRMMTLIDHDKSYTLGCNFAVENGNRVIAKSGGQNGVSSYIWMVPDKRMVMVVMINRFKGGGASSLGKKLRKIALKTNSGSNRPDLIVDRFERIAAPKYKNGKIEIPVRIRVRNTGKGVTQTQIINGIRHGTNYRWTGFMPVIPPNGGARSTEAVIKVPDPNKLLQGRTLTFVATADAPIAAGDTSVSPNGVVLEASEKNNTRELKVKIPGGIGNMAVGQPNQGNAPSTSSTVPKCAGSTRTPPAKRVSKESTTSRKPGNTLKRRRKKK